MPFGYTASSCSTFAGVGQSNSAATVLQLIGLGEMNLALNARSGFTLWRQRTRQVTNTALEASAMPFHTEVAFGSHAQIRLPRQGDLAHLMYVVFCLPGIYGCSVEQSTQSCCGPCQPSTGTQFPCPAGKNSPYSGAYTDSQGNPDCTQCVPTGRFDAHVATPQWYLENYGQLCPPTAQECSTTELSRKCATWVHWAQAIGQLLVKKISLVIGQHETDALYSDFLFMYEELAGKAGLRLQEMIGKYNSRDALRKASRRDQILYVPVPFYCTLSSGNALSLCSIQFHAVSIYVQFEALENCIVRAAPNVVVRKTRDGSPIANSDLQAFFDVTYVYLDVHERNMFANATWEQLITQVQAHCVCQTGCRVVVPLSFSHPMIDLMWAVRRRANTIANNWTNFSGIDGHDPIAHVALHLNNLARFSGREGRYYRLVLPHAYYNHIPAACVYVYNFAYAPLDSQPSNSLNFSRIDNVQMIFDLQEGLGLEDVEIIIFGRNHNVIRYVDGVAGVTFN